MPELLSCPDFLNLGQFNSFSLKLESESLKANPLGDPFLRHNPCLVPNKEGEYDCVYVLSGFTGDGIKKFNFKSFEQNLPQKINEWTEAGAVRPHIYLFVNAWTLWGGSQFINSLGCGLYEDYITNDLTKSLNQVLPENYEIKDRAVLGGSSGGYGALHLCSKHSEHFQHCLAIAPDCDFEISLKNDIYHALYLADRYQGVGGVLEALKNKTIKTGSRDFHKMINPLAMAACYSDIDSSGAPILPISQSGVLNEVLWQKWLEKDPLHFLPKRNAGLKQLKTLSLAVGDKDQFLLQFGLRKIVSHLAAQKIEHSYEEFDGNHFDLEKPIKKMLSLL